MSKLNNNNNNNNKERILNDDSFNLRKRNSAIIIPELSKSLINDVENKILAPYYNNYNINNTNTVKLKLGVIKFSHKGINYIHCPILNLDENKHIKFGICKRFKSLENNFCNRQKLCAHKYRHHFKCNKVLSSNIHIKASQSIEDLLLNYNSN